MAPRENRGQQAAVSATDVHDNRACVEIEGGDNGTLGTASEMLVIASLKSFARMVVATQVFEESLAPQHRNSRFAGPDRLGQRAPVLAVLRRPVEQCCSRHRCRRVGTQGVRERVESVGAVPCWRNTPRLISARSSRLHRIGVRADAARQSSAVSGPAASASAMPSSAAASIACDIQPARISSSIATGAGASL